MKLKNDVELANTRRKLRELEELIEKKQRSPGHSAAHEMSLESMQRFARNLRAEIQEYQNAHQVTH